MDIEKLKAETQSTLHRDRLILLSLFVCGLLGSAALYYTAPELSPKDRQALYRFPSSPRELAATVGVAERYVSARPGFVTASFVFLYVFLQAFAIPGPVLLNIVAGALFGLYKGFALVCVCAAGGATCCYLLVDAFGKGLMLRFFPGMLLKFHQKVRNNEHNLLWFMLSLRVTPLCPKWFTSLASPIVGVPLSPYALGTFFGLMPANFITVSIGLAIASLKSLQGIEPHHLLLLFLLGLAALVPTLFTKRREKTE